MPSTVTLYLTGVWFLAGLTFGAGWTLGARIVTRLVG